MRRLFWLFPSGLLAFILQGLCGCNLVLAVLETIFDFVLGPPPRGVPGEGPDRHFHQETRGFGPIPARIRGVIYF